jgi:hypothetical protein
LPRPRPTPLLRSRPGRPLQTPEGGFGAFLEAVMRFQHAFESPRQGFTEYLLRLYESAARPGISLRHLMRLRKARDVPSFGTLRRIAQGFPAVGEFENTAPDQQRFKEELWTPRLGWTAVRQTWKLLPRGSDISLCMGLLPTWALERLTGPIVQDVGEAILERDLSFNFVFPRAPRVAAFVATGEKRELKGKEILQDLQLGIAKAVLRRGSDSAATRRRIRMRLRAWEIAPSAEGMYFWSRCPRALLISNLFQTGAVAGNEFAAAYEVNQVPYPSSWAQRFSPRLPPPITSAGWGYLLPESHERLRVLFNYLLGKKQVVRLAS